MQEIGKDVELGDFVKALNALVLGFPADGVAFEHSDVQMTAHD